MNKLIPIFAAGALAGLTAKGALFNYDFGTGTGTHNTSSSSTTFLPTPTTNGGTARVRVGTGGGSFEMANPGDTLGTDTELVGTAPTSASVNKFSIYDIGNPSNVFSLSFKLKLTGGTSGTWSMFMGDGATYGDNAAFTGAQVMTGIRWVFGATGAITENYRSGGSWSALSDSFSQDTEYLVEIFANNSLSAANYGNAQTVANGTWDLWVNNTLVGDDLAKGQLANGANIDSFMFYGESSAGNVAKIIVDDFRYATELTVVPEPATAGLLALGLLFLRRRR